MSYNLYLPEGYLIGTPENREYTSTPQNLERAMLSGRILEGMATLCDTSLNLTVDLGCMRGIIPREECALTAEGEIVKDIAVITRVGKAVCFRVKRITRDENGEPVAILSRREAQSDCMEHYLKHLTCGDIIPSKVTHLEHFGAFVDIGCGVVSLLTIDCISVSRITHPRDRFAVGQRIYTVVKSIDPATGRIYVTHKELLGTWEENASLFEVGQTVAGIVRSIEDYGIFIELTPNLAGLAERSGCGCRGEDITVGQTAAVYIKNILPDRMKIKLVLIDSYKGELKPKRLEYMRQVESGSHMELWRYSPTSCRRVVETDFRIPVELQRGN
ncbi:MAG: 30S ribosomal protein S1 [Clostridia bacterium]|nr:30S ribosomal protein S1 [Clostridia bacterium]